MGNGGAWQASDRRSGAHVKRQEKSASRNPLVDAGQGLPAPGLPDLLLRPAPSLRQVRPVRRLGSLRLRRPRRGLRGHPGRSCRARAGAAGPRDGVPHRLGRRLLRERRAVDRRRAGEGPGVARGGGPGREARALPGDTSRTLAGAGERSVGTPAEEAVCVERLGWKQSWRGASGEAPADHQDDCVTCVCICLRRKARTRRASEQD
mmetsp:Transcript_78430/g.229956  ORF Transcript_78430/g.229956 Transcript_78430/m.229956 type:complete len:206 (+) Transcript_78430:644-1261(+)